MDHLHLNIYQEVICSVKTTKQLILCRGNNSTIFHSSLFGLFCVGHLTRIGLNIYEVIQVGQFHYEEDIRLICYRLSALDLLK